MKSVSKKQILSSILSVIIILTSIFAFSSCGAKDDGDITSARLNERGELVLMFSDGSEKNIGAISNEGTTINIQSGDDSVLAATTAGLVSAVSVTAYFEKTVNNSYGGFFPGFGGGTSTSQYSSEGAGVIYELDRESGSAFIITNYHVVYDSASNSTDGISEEIEVYLYGAEGKNYAIPAEYVGGSLYYDIAVLYVENCASLVNSVYNSVKIANSDSVSVGATAIAVGNPRGDGIAASLGVVSVASEYITMTAVDGQSTVSFRVMRVDTAVNSGNSGGGLYNSAGELIGIVNAKIVDDDVENIGYAIPSNVASAVARNIIDNCFGTENKTVMRALIGVTLGTSDSVAVIDEDLGIIKIKEKVGIAEVATGGIAYGKLEAGDVIKSVTVGDKTVSVTRSYHVIDAMLDARVGDVVKLDILRGGREMTVEITITESAIAAY